MTSGRDAAPQNVRTVLAAAPRLPWLLSRKVTIPAPVPGYVHRPELEARAMPVNRRLTVLKASGGFGKTTLLAECCRRLRHRGIPVAWLSLDEHDAPEGLDACIAFACAEAGLAISDFASGERFAEGPSLRIGAVLRGIQEGGGAFVLAFDEADRLARPGSLSMLAALLESAPANLHLAFACRQIPAGLNIAGPVFEGDGDLIDAEAMRFSRPEVARFFDLRLSRRALAKEMDRSAGWPIALRISRNSIGQGEAEGGIGDDLASNWIESRLLACLGPDEKELVLDLGQFAWIDEGLLRAVLGAAGSVQRIDAIAVLDGLIERIPGGSASYRLHPLLREHCAKKRLREDPERFRTIHRRIAAALGHRGETVLAMRHAVAGDDPFLAGDILEQSGGVRLWTRRGVAEFLEADDLLSREVIDERPRLKLARCAALTLSGRQTEARLLYATASLPDGRDASQAAIDTAADDCMVRFAMALYGGQLLGSKSTRDLPGAAAEVAGSPHMEPAIRGHFEYGLSVLHFLRGEFDAALDGLAQSRELLAGSGYFQLYGEMLLGQVEFERGRPQAAEACFRKAVRIAKRHFLRDPVAVMAGEVAAKELALECDRVSSAASGRGLLPALKSRAAPFSFFATGVCVLIDAKLRFGNADDALAETEDLIASARSAGLTSCVRLAAALRVSLLLIAGRRADAERAWQLEGLPKEPADCVDLTAQSWREMVAVTEARTRLMAAGGRLDAARGLVRDLRAVALKRRARRTEMRALGLALALEWQAGETAASLLALQDYLALFADCPYALPLVRERATCAGLLASFVSSHADSPHAQAARTLLVAMRSNGDAQALSLSEREAEVLRLLPGRQDKEIARALGLTASGVRFHLRKLFGKLGAKSRAELIGRAKELRLLSDSDTA